jgi:hypothetical protein
MVRSGVIQGVAEGPLLTQVMAGRTGIQTIFTFLDCQLPLPYTHIICLLVKVRADMTYVRSSIAAAVI